MRVVHAAGLLAMLGSSAGTPAPLTAQAAASRPARLVPDTFEVRGTAVAVESGRIVVPADRSDTSAGTLNLHVVRFASTAEAPAPPIVFLAGGPGDAATRALRGIPLELLNELRAIGDVIAFDQRGTGLSDPRGVACPPGPALPRDRPGDPDRQLEILRTRVADCLANTPAAGVHSAGLTTVESADDLNDLRHALGATKLTLLAGSYGTHLALAAARRHPGLVQRMVLAGVEGPDDTFKLPYRVDSVLATIARARRPPLLDEIRTLLRRVSNEPASHRFPGGRVVVLSKWDLQRWIAESLDAVPAIDAVLDAVPRMLAGDFSQVAAWTLRQRMHHPINLMNLAMDCASYASPGRLARIARETPDALLGNAINFPLPDLCETPGLPRLSDGFRAPPVSDVPALLIAGTFDGRTPPANAHEAARHLPHARVLVLDGVSHGLLGHAEAVAAMLTFLRK